VGDGIRDEMGESGPRERGGEMGDGKELKEVEAREERIGSAICLAVVATMVQ